MNGRALDNGRALGNGPALGGFACPENGEVRDPKLTVLFVTLNFLLYSTTQVLLSPVYG